MGILDNIGIGKKAQAPKGASAASAGSSPTSAHPGTPTQRARPKPGTPGSAPPSSRLPGRKRRKSGIATPKERVAAAAAPLHDRRRRLVGARETTLRDLGGLMLEMYKRNRFREELLLDKCEEVLAIEVEVAHVDQRLFQLAPPNAAGMRPIGRCECGAPIHPGQNFCGVCGRSFTTLTQSRNCARCGAGLRPGDQFCATCGVEAPDTLQTIEAPPSGAFQSASHVPEPSDATAIARTAVAETVIIEAPPLEEPPPAAPPVAAEESVATAPPADAAVVEAAAAPAIVEPAAGSDLQSGFDWSSAPPADDAAIDAAVASIPTSPTDPSTPFAGFPLTATVPPPPIADPLDVVAIPAEPSPAETPPAADTPQAPPAANSKAEAKALAAARKQRAKEAKARAKLRAKAAREARKRGGGS